MPKLVSKNKNQAVLRAWLDSVSKVSAKSIY